MSTLPVLSLLASHSGFSLNLNLFETNIINLAVLIATLVWFLKGFLGGILERRRTSIVADLKEAEERLAKATTALSEAQQGLTQAQQRAEKIVVDGTARAAAIRQESERRSIDEIARIKEAATSDLANEASRVSAQLRRETARQAVEQALAGLTGRLDDKAHASLIDQSIQSLGNS
ncbi:MAG: F0F1 ATP synthase subunit B [Cyanobacteria bacterium]|nr:F0F1 ATP synthase subunit B [Cyanobacteriota bacterium]